jgi:hypothetical protein
MPDRDVSRVELKFIGLQGRDSGCQTTRRRCQRPDPVQWVFYASAAGTITAPVVD